MITERTNNASVPSPSRSGEKVAEGRMRGMTGTGRSQQRTIVFNPHGAWNEAVNSRSRAPALERTALEAPASCDKLARQEPRNKDINPHRVKY